MPCQNCSTYSFTITNGIELLQAECDWKRVLDTDNASFMSRWREGPELSHGFDGCCVAFARKALQHLHLSDFPLARDDKLQEDSSLQIRFYRNCRIFQIGCKVYHELPSSTWIGRRYFRHGVVHQLGENADAALCRFCSHRVVHHFIVLSRSRCCHCQQGESGHEYSFHDCIFYGLINISLQRTTAEIHLRCPDGIKHKSHRHEPVKSVCWKSFQASFTFAP